MKTVNPLFAGLASGWLAWMPVQAQFLSVPLYYGSTNSIVNEFDVMLQGTALEPGDLVQLLRADHGIYPPNRDGTPHVFNPVLAEARIGMGTDYAAGAIGKFSASVSINRFVVTPMFVRVYNRYTLDESSFYGDSQIYSNSVTTYGVFVAQVPKTCLPLDPDDDDGDGLSNSLEKSLGTDPLLVDTDGDGVPDDKELLAGTNPLDPTDHLQMARVRISPQGDILVHWNSAPGKRYQLEYCPDLLSDPVVFIAHGDVIEASEPETHVVLAGGVDLFPNAVFRVRLMVTP
ncbi:MAG TPA: thrombospondin type 3 repeat-containing protein [Kiritimatiellia bacterium]|nr:thrombospondin type 3 repeat-containing protein [Kiritimatiellia bacterium]HMO99841.1 thrombospondin type 3 repeat-containing protein [Kiritimatiellia bacterium]